MANQDSAWRQAVIYQIYPWTFHEDTKRMPQKGVGSLRGIIEKIPYIREELGADAIWLSPIYTSPMMDGGYDISNYNDVHQDLGNLQDFKDLIQEAHEVGVKVMVDFVPNHTSDQHEWFAKSRKREKDFEDWYIWHPGKKDDQGNRTPPNNWASVFSMPNKRSRNEGNFPDLKEGDWTPPVSAWQWDDDRNEYYLRTFAKKQPDLNWSNPLVREAMKDVMRFWLDLGVDGFRIDAVNHLGKNMHFDNEEVNHAYNEEFYDNPYDQLLKENSCGYWGSLHGHVWEITEVLRDERYEDRDLRIVMEAHMGESDLRQLNDVAPDLAATFNFGAMRLNWGVAERKIHLDYYYQNLSEMGIANQVNGNHDEVRLATRCGDSIARTVAVMNFFLPGMRFVYNGEELGLHNAKVPHEKTRDHENGYRDGERTPFIWNVSEKNAGFSNAESDQLWLPVNEDDFGISLNSQKTDAKSSFSLYRTAIKLCRELTAIQSGKYESLQADNAEVFAFERRSDNEKVVVVVNFSSNVQRTRVATDFAGGKIILSSIDVDQEPRDVNLEDGVDLKPDETLVIVAG